MSLPEGFSKAELSEFWKPENAGDNIQGTIVEIADSANGMLYTLLLDDGTKVCLPSHSYIVNRLRECKVGDEVYVEYIEKKRTQKGNAFLYEVGLKVN